MPGIVRVASAFALQACVVSLIPTNAITHDTCIQKNNCMHGKIKDNIQNCFTAGSVHNKKTTKRLVYEKSKFMMSDFYAQCRG